jgi:flagellar motor switch protein FliG
MRVESIRGKQAEKIRLSQDQEFQADIVQQNQRLQQLSEAAVVRVNKWLRRKQLVTRERNYEDQERRKIVLQSRDKFDSDYRQKAIKEVAKVIERIDKIQNHRISFRQAIHDENLFRGKLERS